jgi:tetratricopeptide (TPR) repeat protein
MTDAQKTVFISYRRSTGSFIARAVFMDLRANGYDAFLDIETIDSGAFDSIILHQIAARAHFVLILSPGSLERCASPDDWLRREIETAMDLQRNIVPLMVGDFSFAGTEAYLTGRLSALPRYNGVKLLHDYFDEGMARLRDRYLKPPQIPVIQPTPAGETQAVEQKIAQVVSKGAPSKDDMVLAGMLRNRSFGMLHKQNYAGAVEALDQALHLNPDDAELYFFRGQVRQRSGDYAAARADFDEALRRNPAQRHAALRRAELNLLDGQPDAALADLYIANSARAADPQVMATMALSHAMRGEYEEARRLWLMLAAVDERYKDATWAAEQYHWADALRERLERLLKRIYREKSS